MNGLASTLLAVLVASIIEQNPAHYLRRDAEEMGAILPLDLSLIDQTQVRFVDQRGRLQGMIRVLPPHVAVRQAMQFALNEGQEPFEGRLIAVAPIHK